MTASLWLPIGSLCGLRLSCMRLCARPSSADQEVQALPNSSACVSVPHQARALSPPSKCHASSMSACHALTTLDASVGPPETIHLQFLPGGRKIIGTVVRERDGRSEYLIGSCAVEQPQRRARGSNLNSRCRRLTRFALLPPRTDRRGVMCGSTSPLWGRVTD